MEPRKATDILLAIEAKLDTALAAIRAQDLNQKIMSNKLNELLAKIDSVEAAEQPVMAKPFVEAPIVTSTDPELSIKVEAEQLGFRRTSRPETYATPTLLNEVRKPAPPPPAEPVPPPVISRPPPPSEEEWKTISMPALPKMKSEEASSNIGKVAVEQRSVDKNGKAVFLANIEITDKETNKVESKTRTTSVGKWQAVLPPGIYNVKITKSESVSKQKIEVNQEITIDGNTSTQTLPLLMVK